jgi:ABC-type lipoprotein export system ATPase subunit
LLRAVQSPASTERSRRNPALTAPQREDGLDVTREIDAASLIELRDVTKSFRSGDVVIPVLRGISCRIAAGEFVALMGASGSGKSTLMNILGCLDRPTTGEYRFEGREVSRLSSEERARLRNERMGFVFQSFNLLPRTSAIDNVMIPLSYASPTLPDEEARARARTILQRVGLGDRLDYPPSRLSGGQQQRVAIARALVNRPTMLLADEPTGNLDSRTTSEMLKLFRDLNVDGGITIVLVTHDAEVARTARRVLRLKDGVIVSDAAPATAVTASLEQV